MLKKLRNRGLLNLSNLPGWQTNRKIIVFESDDWGAVRMSSAAAYRQLCKKFQEPNQIEGNIYLTNDGLASESDLTGLFEVLSSVKDKNLASAVFTVVSVVANPIFEKIRKSEYTEYYYEPFPDTLRNYPFHSRSFELWKQGVQERIFIPQFHGREHLNVINWMEALRLGDKDTVLAFEYQVYGITPSKPINHVSYLAAFDFNDPIEIDYHKSVINEGLDLFADIHDYYAKYFIPTNGPFNNSLEKTAAEKGIEYLGTAKVQDEPIGWGRTRRHYHYPGQRNKTGQLYLTRNCVFEPSSSQKNDWVDACLNDISIAFRWRKPAVISTHRVNYIGWINPENRDRGLVNLKRLLHMVIKTWPDVEFMTSDSLGDIMKFSSRTREA